jgi:hypothetical protein
VQDLKAKLDKLLTEAEDCDLSRDCTLVASVALANCALQELAKSKSAWSASEQALVRDVFSYWRAHQGVVFCIRGNRSGLKMTLIV